MAQAYALDSENNIRLAANNSINRVSKGAEVVQNVRSRLLFYFGESPMDTSKGVPYYERIFKKPVDLPEAESIIKTVILQTDDVKELLDFGLDFDSAVTRKMTVTYSATTIYGDTIGATVNNIS